MSATIVDEMWRRHKFAENSAMCVTVFRNGIRRHADAVVHGELMLDGNSR
jgi:hypothetical protein